MIPTGRRRRPAAASRGAERPGPPACAPCIEVYPRETRVTARFTHFLDGSLKRACAAGCTPIVGEASVVAPDQVANGARDYPPMGRMVDVAGGVLATAHPDLGSRGSVYRYRKHLT